MVQTTSSQGRQAMERVMILGSGGQIGSDLAPHLVSRERCTVKLVDRLPPDEVNGAAALAAAFRDEPWRDWWVVADATDRHVIRPLIAEFKPDVIYHLVALLSAAGERAPEECWRLNMESLNVLFEAVRDLSSSDYRPVVVWPSSVAVYGVPLQGYCHERVCEDYPLEPHTMYGATKVAGELLGKYFSKAPLAPLSPRPTVDFRSLRFPGLLSATPPGGGSSDYANMMYFQAAGHEKGSLFVSRDTRMPFMHMADAIKALVDLARAEETQLSRRVYNVRAFAPTVDEFVASIRRRHPGFDVSSVPDFRQQIVDSWPQDMNDAAARADWGFSPTYDLDRTTDDLIEAIGRSYPPNAAAGRDQVVGVC
jgi:threonine 3-dehydrogenase